MSSTVGVLAAAINAAVLQEKRAAQAHKIGEIKTTLASSGCHTVNNQALALGLCRSTTWHLLTGGHKHCGLTARVVNTILSSPLLPAPVRLVIRDYVQRKLAGEYRHSANAIARFKSRLPIASLLSDPSHNFG